MEVAVVARAGSARRRNLAPPLRSGARSRCGARRGGPAMPPPRRSPLPPRKRPRAVVVSASAPFVLSRSEGREFPCVTRRHRPGRAAAQVRAPRPGTWNGSSLLDTPWQAYRRAYQSAGRGQGEARSQPEAFCCCAWASSCFVGRARCKLPCHGYSLDMAPGLKYPFLMFCVWAYLFLT